MDGSVSTDPYLRSARLVREISGGGRCLLHPDRPGSTPSRRRGYLWLSPSSANILGSGNILAKHLLAELWQRIDAPPPPSVQRVKGGVRRTLLREHVHTLRDPAPSAWN